MTKKRAKGKEPYAARKAGLAMMAANPDRFDTRRRTRKGRNKHYPFQKGKLRGGKPGLVQERLHVAGLLGTGLSVKTVAARTGLTYMQVDSVQKQMREETLRGEAFRKAAQEAREKIQGGALQALSDAIELATKQIKEGVKGSNGRRQEAPLSHVAQAVRSLSEVAMHKEREDEKPRQPDPASTVPLTARQIGELLMQVRDHEQAKSRKEVDVTPLHQKALPQ